MKDIKIHMVRIRKMWGGTLRGTLCNRLSNAGEDMNLTHARKEVTCKFCLRILESRK